MFGCKLLQVIERLGTSESPEAMRLAMLMTDAGRNLP